MAYIIDCEDGVQIRGETEDEVLANAFAHIESAHPDLVGKLGRDQLLGMAQLV